MQTILGFPLATVTAKQSRLQDLPVLKPVQPFKDLWLEKRQWRKPPWKATKLPREALHMFEIAAAEGVRSDAVGRAVEKMEQILNAPDCNPGHASHDH